MWENKSFFYQHLCKIMFSRYFLLSSWWARYWTDNTFTCTRDHLCSMCVSNAVFVLYETVNLVYKNILHVCDCLFANLCMFMHVWAFFCVSFCGSVCVYLMVRMHVDNVPASTHFVCVLCTLLCSCCLTG